jgi:antibiotic biosynthesis monooxygenase (ABM) superfamily enzyme
MHAGQIDKDGPVTVVVTRIAKKDKIREFEEWMDGIIHEAMRFEGHMGVNVIRPSDLSNPEYVIIFRFNTFENLAKWENSETRREWLAKSKEVTEGEPVVEKQTGLEIWFTPPRSRSGGGSIKGDKAAAPLPPPSSSTTTAAIAPPPRYKMAIIITAIIFVLVSILIPQIRQLTTGLHIHLSTFIGVVIMVLLMTYVIMPFLTRLLGPWLSKKRLF